MQFIIPPQLTEEQRMLLTIYLSDDYRLKRSEWPQIFKAVDWLGQAKVVTHNKFRTFRQLYLEYIDTSLADLYLEQLLALSDVQKESPPLIAAFARQVQVLLRRAGLLGSSESWLLLAYCLYWWQSFARGYTFEVEIIRDLQDSGLIFEAHDLSRRWERYSPADLEVLGLAGDIKTSTYFLKSKPRSPLRSDFYITRLYEKGRSRTLVVFQKTLAWDKINGSTIDGTLANLQDILPYPVRIQQSNTTLVVVDYTLWKQRVLQVQQDEGADYEKHH